jgi:hypothetical protein
MKLTGIFRKRTAVLSVSLHYGSSARDYTSFDIKDYFILHQSYEPAIVKGVIKSLDRLNRTARNWEDRKQQAL